MKIIDGNDPRVVAAIDEVGAELRTCFRMIEITQDRDDAAAWLIGALITAVNGVALLYGEAETQSLLTKALFGIDAKRAELAQRRRAH